MGETLLHWAVGYGRYSLIEGLVAMEAEVKVEDNYGDTPLHIVCSMGHEQCVILLVKQG